MDDQTAFVELLEFDIVASAMIVVDDHTFCTCIETCGHRSVDFTGQQFTHTFSVGEPFRCLIEPVLIKAPTGDSLNIGLNINFHFLSSGFWVLIWLLK
ncbi:hypothetical protein SDC9_167412 [bioreactor metagenome]|uniref:Uncharacterized protein n=1 Tax=bioreactor metagenome TaxID=1076179 RepID=A0A645G1J6_9ZZZZ